jgi:serine/threonine protein kinase
VSEAALEGLADRYRVEGELGAGGMAIVYRAIDRKHDRPVAVKVMRPEIAAAMGRERFLSEISIAARLQHPHILSLIDSGDIDGTLFYVMPYLEGETLAQKIAREKQLAVNEAMQIATEVVSALRYAHQHGVLHRDIKPANIMLTGGHAVVMDFGIARAMDKASSRLTGTGMMVGTPAYMGPEHFEGNVDTRSDIYAVGCMLYESLAGEPPFTGPTAQSILLKHLGGDVPSLLNVRRDVPRHVDLLVMRALAKKPDDRFPDMTTFHAELQLAASGASSVSVHPVAPSEPRTPANHDAYDTYLRGIHSFDKRTQAGNERALSLLESATRQDPKFAPAFAALAAAYVEKFFTYDPNEEWEERAFVAIEKARALDPNLAKIYVVKGNILWTRARRWPHFEAIDEFRKALALDPNCIEALNELGKVLWHIGQIDEAVEHLERVIDLDAAFSNGRFRLGMAEMCRGSFERSLEVFRMLPVGSHGSSVVALTALNLHYLGKTEEGRSLLAQATKAEREDDADFPAIESIFLAVAGKHDDAERAIARAIEVGHDRGHFHHAMCYIASARVLMGEVSTGIEELRRGAEDGFPCYPWFEIDPCLESIRDNPRFVKLIGDLKSRWGKSA